MRQTEWQYMERCNVFGGEWQVIRTFNNLADARKWWNGEFKNNVDARLIERDVYESVLYEQMNQK